MYKIITTLLITLFAGCLHADTLAQWSLNNQDEVKKVGLYAATKSGARAVKSFENDCLKVNIYNGQMHPANIQLFLTAKTNIISGEKYHVEFSIKTVGPQRIIVQCALNTPPWSKLGPKSSLVILTKGDKWEKYSYDFIADKNINKSCRIPVFMLGEVKNGTTVELKDVIFSGPKTSAKQPAVSATGKADPGLKKKLAGTSVVPGKSVTAAA